jgi:hypothetical protein
MINARYIGMKVLAILKNEVPKRENKQCLNQ